MNLYALILTDRELSYDNHSEDFFIGIFAERQQAEETAHYYLENVADLTSTPALTALSRR